MEQKQDTIKFDVDTQVDISAHQLAELLKKFILIRLSQEIKQVSSKHPSCFESVTTEGVKKDGLYVNMCDHRRPYGVVAVEVVPYNAELRKIYDAAQAIMAEVGKDPVYDYDY